MSTTSVLTRPYDPSRIVNPVQFAQDRRDAAFWQLSSARNANLHSDGIPPFAIVEIAQMVTHLLVRECQLRAAQESVENREFPHNPFGSCQDPNFCDDCDQPGGCKGWDGIS